MSGFIPSEYAMLAIGFVALGAAMICLRVVAEAIEAAVRRHDLRVEAGHLRIEQARKLYQLRMQSVTGRARSRRHSTSSVPAAPTPEVAIAEEFPADGNAAPEETKPAMKQAA